MVGSRGSISGGPIPSTRERVTTFSGRAAANIASSSQGPDEFAILPNKPLQQPEDFTAKADGNEGQGFVTVVVAYRAWPAVVDRG